MVDGWDARVLGLALAVGIGFLVGIEREWHDHKPLGLRSFALVGACGGLAGMLAGTWGVWIVASGLLGVAAVVLAPFAVHRSDDDGVGGATTLLAGLAVYLVGAAAAAGFHGEAVVVGGLVTVLLHWKEPLHGMVKRFGREDISAVARFVLITLVVLPVLPDATYGPFDVVNPFRAWLLVVLIVGLNLSAYVTARLVRADLGAVLGGLLGGMISSTATTVSFAGMSRRHDKLASSASFVILLASAVVYARVVVELLFVSPGLVRHAWAPMAVFALVVVAIAAVFLRRVHRDPVELPEQANPARLRAALAFGALYVVVGLAVAAAKRYLGDDAVYGVAVVSGLTDVDALTLSVAQLHDGGSVGPEVAWRAIFLATLSNLAFKIGAVCVLGSARLRRQILVSGLVALAAGTAILALWP